MTNIAIIGTGFVADLYMRSLATFPDLRLVGAHDTRPDAQRRFCDHWKVPGFDTRDDLLAALGADGIVLNLTNPGAHFEVSKACLEAGHHVYSEKPLATRTEDAKALCALAQERGLMIGSAPCSYLSEAAQTVAAAVRSDVLGRPRLIYAELDDDFIPQAPYRKWLSESGAPWPAEDEFRVGCTLEHAGYYLTWLIATFGTIRTVVAASAHVVADLLPVEDAAPDFSVATLFFESGLVARLTCSIAAPHDHRLKIIGDKGVLQLDEAWNNTAKVGFRKRFVLRRKLITAPIARRLRLTDDTHPKVGRWGAAAMNFALGPAEMARALQDGRPSRVGADLALHLTEVTLAIQNAGEDTGAQRMTTRCDPVTPMPWAQQIKGQAND
ncbi:Gfo/Idh/MocA family oxidoreductase [Actibacterium sp. XHP0104]|uniref:Gfo/Idh/MocA family oxidoreductase n=1 Tax=Actibacterium sp. XHP0104 TaxID=2984335 RepID=UPI0021E73830|nr:Gfo/Idh/MocA family oxidoreductase [Actibacterium sp. XHP0104]MCV2881865.1 Gfo/Idh/MocA family oxidoreductase [Actibacterium sp. XHP0104]